jgi:hypothetical protein
MSIKNIHYSKKFTSLESGKQFVECDFHFYSTGEFSLIRPKNNWIPEMINGILPAKKFNEFNELINRDVFLPKMKEFFGENVITSRTKHVDTVHLACCHDDTTKNEEIDLLYDSNPLNIAASGNSIPQEEVMLLETLAAMSHFIFYEMGLETQQ